MLLDAKQKNRVKKTYKIKEIHYTLQGEGYHSGRPAIFCRFSGCNLWSGLEKDRPKAICQFCDTDFWGIDGNQGGKYKGAQLADLLDSLWPKNNTSNKFVVFTGGEPLLQLDTALCDQMHAIGFEIAVETNGTITPPEGIDWICMSPKANTDILLTTGHELKIVYPQRGIDPIDFEHMNFANRYLQPMDNEQQAENTKACVDYCKENPKWKLSVQTHKILNIP